MDDLIDKLLESLWLQDRLSYNTLQSYRRDLVKVAARLTEGGQDWLSADEFALSDAVYAEGEKNTSQARALSACKRMYGWLEETGQRADNPTRFLKAPKSERKLPTLITEAQIDALLAEPDVETLHGLRDKALLEVMYATGLRVTEAVKLTLSDIDLHRGSIRTIGKGDKLRLVPLGQEAGVLGGTLLQRIAPVVAEKQNLRRSVCQPETQRHQPSTCMDDSQRICRSGRYCFAQSARFAPCFCHAFGQSRRRFAFGPDDVGTFRHQYHADLYPCCQYPFENMVDEHHPVHK